MGEQVRVGILGAGMIATCDWGILPGLAPIRDRVAVTAITSRTRSSAQSVADQFAIENVHDSLDEMLDSDIDAVVNLTPIPVHAQTSAAILRAGKHLVSEKPLASTMSDASMLIELARDRGVHIVCSPPRMIEPARIRARELIDAGAIGQPAFARVRSSHAGPAWRAWPSDPTWFYAADSGPLLDMGVYGIQEITGLLGPARRVFAAAGRTSLERIAAGGAFAGTVIPIESDDNVIVVLEFDGNVYAVVDSTFNVRASRSPAVEIFGHGGTIVLNDDLPSSPAVELYSVAADGVSGEWSDATGPGFAERAARSKELRRASLIAHLIDCLDGATPVLTGEHARHTLEIMLGAVESARAGVRVELTTTF